MKIRNLLFLSIATIVAVSCGSKAKATDDNAVANEQAETAANDTAVVYYIKDITPENMVKIYEALGRKADGKVAVKLSTGEKGNTHYLQPSLIGPLVQSVGGTIVECNTAYTGARYDTEEHLLIAKEHGFNDIADVVILDAEEEIALPVEGGKHLKENYVGKDWEDYDFTMVLSHFKGHQMAGFGGAMKNISIGLASGDGKSWIHTAGKTKDRKEIWDNIADDDSFQEAMAEASKSVVDKAGDKILYINVANNLSIDCDCNGNPHAPTMADLGIFASLDPVAVDQACIDAVEASEDPGKIHLIQRIDSKNGRHNLEYAEQIGVGTRNYKLVELK